MGRKLKKLKPITTEEENKEYLRRIFSIMKKMEGVMDLRARKELNSTELRLISEVVLAKMENRRLISTQVASNLGITRSAVSQMVNALEKDGVLRRVPDEVDKKIAYLELTEWAEEHFQGDISAYGEFISQLVVRFGVARLEKMLALMGDFVETVELLKTMEN